MPTEKKLKILFIEDNLGEIRLMQEASKIAKTDDLIEFDTATDGEEALVKLNSYHQSGKLPDLVLLDLNLPRLHGIEVLHEIKVKAKTYIDVPVIILSNSNNKKDIIDCYRNLADGYIQKPKDFEKMVNFFRVLKDSFESNNKVSVLYLEKEYYDFVLAS